MVVQSSDLTFDSSQQTGRASGSERARGQSLAAFGLCQLDVKGGLGTFECPPGVQVNVTVPTAEQRNDLLLRDQIDLINLLTVCCSYDHCRERETC